jgi:hypothetical protein
MRRRTRDLIAAEIAGHRARTETLLSALLRRTKSTATLADIQTLIFEEREDRHSTEYFCDLIALFDTRHGSVDIDEVLPAIQDAWNYFPHRRFRGECPAERLLQPGRRLN